VDKLTPREVFDRAKELNEYGGTFTVIVESNEAELIELQAQLSAQAGMETQFEIIHGECHFTVTKALPPELP